MVKFIERDSDAYPELEGHLGYILEVEDCPWESRGFWTIWPTAIASRNLLEGWRWFPERMLEVFSSAPE